MCGVVATIANAERAARLVHALAHRGPDATGLHIDGPVAVGATRLRINGDARGDQPLVGARGLVLAANGEVFNHADLATRAPGASDLGPLLHALETRGIEALASVQGPFALALWDPHARTLTLARDPVGVRPLFLDRRSGFAAASEVGALLATGEPAASPAGFDAVALAHLLAFQFLPPERTLFTDIVPVAPGEAWTFAVDAAAGAAPVRRSVAYAPSAATSVADALRSAAVRQASHATRAAIFLSGGLDSSAVAGLLRAAGGDQPLAMVGWFPGAGDAFDERPHARAVAGELGLDLLEVPLTADDVLAAVPAVVRALGGPVAGPGAFAQHVLARAAQAAGVRVVFSGQGGDEIFGGYERHRLLHQLERTGALNARPGYEPLARAMSTAAAAGDDPYAAAVWRGAEILSLLEPATAADVRAAARALPAGGDGQAGRALGHEMATFLPGLLAVEDHTLAAFGIEGRVPLLDPVVVASAAAVPFSEKSPWDSPRRLFREAVGSHLPAASARRRDKMGFPMPLDAWWAGPWRESAARIADDSLLTPFGFRPGAAAAALAAGALSARTRTFLFALATFAQGLGCGATRGVATAAAVVAPATAHGSAR